MSEQQAKQQTTHNEKEDEFKTSIELIKEECELERERFRLKYPKRSEYISNLIFQYNLEYIKTRRDYTDRNYKDSFIVSTYASKYIHMEFATMLDENKEPYLFVVSRAVKHKHNDQCVDKCPPDVTIWLDDDIIEEHWFTE